MVDRRRRTVACYCATFLKPEMQHIYRQISAVNRFRLTVFTRKRENAVAFPFSEVVEVPRGWWLWLRRIIFRQLLRRPIFLSGAEVRRLRAELEKHHCALLHVFFGNTGVQLLPLLADSHRLWPAIVSFHGADVLVELDRPGYRKSMLELFGRVDLVLARTRQIGALLAQIGCPPEKIRLNRTGIPLAQFPYRKRENPNGKFRLFQACRLIEKKGLGTSLRAFAQFGQTYPEAELTIAGEGPLEAELRRMAGELGVAGRVHFLGFVTQDELVRRLDESHVFLHPSELGKDGNQEGVPNSLLEAMATGLPVFATTHGGISEAIEHGVNGWLVAERDHEALGRALVELAGDPERMETMGAAAAKSVAANFSLAAQARHLEDCYQEAIEEAWVSPPGADKG